ncbi:regulatory iron-sulfur-containing complex subunit RicT [Phycisphaeraceae bacterium D3-23]
MPGTIVPLPVMLEEADQKIYDALEAPKSMVVRYGYERMVAELPYNGDAKPGCGSKLVAVTPRGTELVEMLTTTCSNSGCGKSVSRKEMLQYIENSGGKNYPFTTRGKILRVATIDDLNEQTRLDARKPAVVRGCKKLIEELKLPMNLVEVEFVLGDEQVSFYFTAEDRVDFRELVRRLASELQTRIEMIHVSDREEARLVADYEKCGQHCCCRQFLKVLKPVSMRTAKVQKNTLDPQKISGRCGRLMCCLRYEDQTYSELKKLLPHRKSLVETEDGVGVVLSSQILTQLALVKIGVNPPAAYPIENIRQLNKEETAAWRAEFGDPGQVRDDGRRRPQPPQPRTQQKPGPKPPRAAAKPPQQGAKPQPGNTDTRPPKDQDKPAGYSNNKTGQQSPPRRPKPGKPLTGDEVQSKEGDLSANLPKDNNNPQNQTPTDGEAPKKKRRRRRRRKRKGPGGPPGQEGGNNPPPPAS